MWIAQTFHDFTRHAMSPVAAVALHSAIGAFFIAAITALAALLQPTRIRMKWANWAGAFATGSLIGYFAIRFANTGTEPLQNMFDVVGLSALFLALVYFVAIRMKKLESVGAFAYPAIAVIFLVNLLLARTATQGGDAPITSPLLVAHIVLIILAYGVFFMATVAAVMFLLQERMLKKRKDPSFMRTFPSLESLRSLVNACVVIGLPLVTVGFALGFASFRAEDWAHVYSNPKVLSSLVLWLVLLAVVIGRRFGWLHGRRHFYLVLVGFALVLATYVGLGLVEARDKGTNPPNIEGKSG
ncbi:MAG: cytochrome c biogenesis protein CcsA [Planctomycetes bacterium]|nr:cytochrome c biogenesis protein CcsA [Planctomycetota bacterium]